MTQKVRVIILVEGQVICPIDCGCNHMLPIICIVC